jgi:glycerophosphoryl diester phosphodiesterase
LVDRGGNLLATLEDVLAQFNAAYLDIELKTSGSEESIVAALKANLPQRGYIVSSFFPNTLERVHGLDSSVPLGFLCERQKHIAAWRDLAAGAFLPRYDLVKESLIEEVHDAGRQVMTWTVNSSRQMRRLADWGIDGLISDDPQLLYQTFHNG